MTDSPVTLQTLSTEELLKVLSHDRQGNFAMTTINLLTKSGTLYQITVLPGSPQRGGLGNRTVNFRKVEYIRTEKDRLPDPVAHDQFVYFDGSVLSIYPKLPSLPRFGESEADREARDDDALISTPITAINLVIDWSKL